MTLYVSFSSHITNPISEQYFTPFLDTNMSISTLKINASSSEVRRKTDTLSLSTTEHNKNENKNINR